MLRFTLDFLGLLDGTGWRGSISDDSAMGSELLFHRIWFFSSPRLDSVAVVVPLSQLACAGGVDKEEEGEELIIISTLDCPECGNAGRSPRRGISSGLIRFDLILFSCIIPLLSFKRKKEGRERCKSAEAMMMMMMMMLLLLMLLMMDAPQSSLSASLFQYSHKVANYCIIMTQASQHFAIIRIKMTWNVW